MRCLPANLVDGSEEMQFEMSSRSGSVPHHGRYAVLVRGIHLVIMTIEWLSMIPGVCLKDKENSEDKPKISNTILRPNYLLSN